MVSKKAIEALQNNGFNVEIEENSINVQQCTPAGEDWWMDFSDDSDLKEFCESFDPEEEFEMWFDARHKVAGVPSIPDLWKDQIWKQETLNKVLEEIA